MNNKFDELARGWPIGSATASPKAFGMSESMKQIAFLWITGSALWCVFSASAGTLYVNLNNLAPAPPYTTWVTAAINIQDAVDVAVDGDLILVTNGMYQTGARAMYGMSNRVAVTKPVTVRSVNGPAVTTIVGYQVPGTTNGLAALRCVYLTNDALLAGFTLTYGATQTSGDPFKNESGGGVWCEPAGAVVTNCLVTGNSAYVYGGGAFRATLDNCTLTGDWANVGGGASYGTLNNCTLTGNSASNGGAGAYFSTLNNCTLTGNSAQRGDGGGAAHGTLNNCTLMGNWALAGGGASDATLNNCTLTGNSAAGGGGAYQSTLNNCTLTGNSAQRGDGGGTSLSTNYNCIVYYNTARLNGDNYDGNSTLNYCCTTPLPGGGSGNFTDEPQLAGNWHLSAGSPCRGAGIDYYANGLDLDDEPWGSPPSVGCDEYWSGSVTGALSVAIQTAYTNVAVGFAVDFQGLIGGRVSGSRWNFADGVVVSNRPYTTHAWSLAGDYVVELRAYNESYPGGVAASVAVHVLPQPVHYVVLNSVAPMPPYTNWATAATRIQDAVDAATVPGALALVSNGVYQVGAVALYGMSNRVAVTKPVTVRSVNGPAATTIAGYQVPGTTNGLAAVRCVYLTSGAILAGFTLTNGATQTSGDSTTNESGGGVWCESASTVVTNCVVTGNSAYYNGGGAYSGALNNCTVRGNSAQFGGGTCYGTLNNCVLTDNSASSGGGAENAMLNNCTLTGNSASSFGGGADGGALNNCTLTGNSAGAGGGVSYGTLNNCIVYYNSDQVDQNHINCTFNYSCTTPLPPGPGNMDPEPLFVNTNAWSNLRLQSNSPCIDAGNNGFVSWPFDLDGQARISNGTVDMGAYEYNPLDPFHAWLGQYGLPTDGSADYVDTDLDGHNNWQEWVAGTNPTNAASVLRLSLPVVTSPASVTLTWSSVADRSYALERASSLGVAPAFSVVQSNIAGLPSTTSWTDTNAPGSPRFYRVRVER